MLFSNFRFQFIITSYYSKELKIAANLYYDYQNQYGYTPKLDYFYCALLYVASDKKLSVNQLLGGIDRKSMSLFYKEVEKIEALKKKTFKKKECHPSDMQEPCGVSQGFL